MKREWPKAAEVLASGGTITVAATAAGVSRQTVHRWLADEPLFVDTVADARTAMIEPSHRNAHRCMCRLG